MKGLFIIFVVLSSCTQPVTDQEQQKNDSTSGNTEAPAEYKVYENEKVTIWSADSTVGERIEKVHVKFEPHIGFSDFPVTKIYHGEKAPLKLESNPGARRFRTRLREGYADSMNFAGHYCFVYWGCGSPCQAAMIVDALTGKIYDAPGASLGYEYHADSRLLIVNPPPDEDHPYGFFSRKKDFYSADCIYCYPLVYIWNEDLKVFEERLPKGTLRPSSAAQ